MIAIDHIQLLMGRPSPNHKPLGYRIREIEAMEKEKRLCEIIASGINNNDDIARAYGIKPCSINRTLRSMVDRGLIRRLRVEKRKGAHGSHSYVYLPMPSSNN